MDERWETVDLLARSGIGRFRRRCSSRSPGTESYRLAVEGGYIDKSREVKLTDFTESSCMDFGEEENLFIDKLATCMPWFVNARLERYRDAPASARYRPIVERVLAMPREEWERFKPTVRALDAELSRRRGRRERAALRDQVQRVHGRARRLLLAEEAGIEWHTAAAKPVPERLAELALAAAASEVC
jgi:hypothetical protein